MPHMPVLHTPEEDLTYFSTTVFVNSEVWLVQREGIVVGFIAVRVGWVDHLYIHPDHQRLGFGSQLLTVAQQSQPTLRLWTFQCNQPARRFYEHHGFCAERETDGSGNDERQPDVLYLWTSTPATDRPQSR